MPFDVTPRNVRWAITKSPGSTAPTGGERNVVTHFEVHRATDDLYGTVARIGHDPTNSVRSVDGVDFVDPRDHDLFEPGPNGFHGLNDEPEIVQDQSELVHGFGKVNELAQPRDGHPHGNCLRNRTSLSLSAAHVGEVMAHLGAAVDPESKREAAPLIGVDAHGFEHRGVHHAAAAELHPAGLRTRSAPVTPADRAGDLEFGRRLREREVGRSQPGALISSPK
jgi:hypothetical protein